MKKILFTHSYSLWFDPKQMAIGHPYPPLGTLYAAALMRQNGYGVSLYDVMFARDTEDLVHQVRDYQPDFFVIYDDGFNYLTKMCLTNMRELAFRMIKLARLNNCTVIVCSSDSTDHYAEYLAEGADFIILGEGELTLLELVNELAGFNAEPGTINGIAHRFNGRVTTTPKRPVLRELDRLPLPAWDLVQMERYRETWIKSSGYFSLNMNTTRGCPYKCNWCAKPIYGNRYNSRSPQHVVWEMKMLREMYGVEHIWFCDDIFGLKPGWVKEFSILLREEQLRIPFKIQARADLMIDEEMVRALASAGCDNVWIGAESGSQKVLDAMDKGITIDQIRTATPLMKKYGIKPSFFIQFGYPGETKEDIWLTIDLINELLPAEIGISVSYPLPGTGFYERVREELKLKANWTDSDEMALMFTNTYPPAYYKQLHTYVHQNYHTHLAKNSIRNLLRNPLRASAVKLKSACSFLYYAPLTYMQKIKLNRLEKAI
ncbi:B12-binding domain-containing radical SAM protein [Flavihumibacter solisilvae]|uniref:Radical SAM protein n=1 Tax=Flavihumibacter solisilvae TaxID=1349421 RepID=A0A0C1IHS2_9BACT|nr:radical SAM protein [Flavihumibacter solisilvae]KIC93760.1 radical SAM protein [Flavihumibacter solisilvae]